jgi:DNA-binding GntR family transcriptional regulator
MANLTTVERRSSVDAVAERLRENIIRGDIAPGERITEMELAAGLGIGRSTVRTALLELEKDELVVRKPYSAWAVSEITETKIREIYSLRGALEELAISLVVGHLGEEERLKLDTAFARFEKAEHGEIDRTDADLAFHRTIVQLSGHSKLIKVYQSLLLQVEWIYRWSERRKPSSIELVEWHRPIYEGLIKGDAKAASEATRRNYASASSADLAGVKSTE